MDRIITLVAADTLSDTHIDSFCRTLAQDGCIIGDVEVLRPGRAYQIDTAGFSENKLRRYTRAFVKNAPIDYAIQPFGPLHKKLLAVDMDGTIIENESLNEIGAMIGLGQQFRDRIKDYQTGRDGFAQPFIDRIAMLKDQPEVLLEAMIKQLRLTPGTRRLIKTMKAKGAYTVLITGGLTPTAKHLQKALGFDKIFSNTIEIKNHAFTGKVVEPILNGRTKQKILLEVCNHQKIRLDDALAIGDGANDRFMIESAGLGLAYRGADILYSYANAHIKHTSLTTALYFQGYHESEIASL